LSYNLQKAMIGNPNLVLLDEPVSTIRFSSIYLVFLLLTISSIQLQTSGVDPVARREFWKIIYAIKESGRSIILTSHRFSYLPLRLSSSKLN